MDKMNRGVSEPTPAKIVHEVTLREWKMLQRFRSLTAVIHQVQILHNGQGQVTHLIIDGKLETL